MGKRNTLAAILASILLVTGCSKSGGDVAGAGNFFTTPQNESANNNPQSSSAAESLDPIRELIEEAEDYAAAGDYERALIKIKAALNTYPDSTELKSKEAEYTKLVNEKSSEKTLNEAKSYADSGDFLKAAIVIKDAMKNEGENEEYKAAYDMYYQKYLDHTKNSALATADEFMKSKKYFDALSTLSTALDIVEGDTDIVGKIKSCAAESSEKLTENGEYLSAVKILKTAMTIIDADDDISQRYESCIETYLADLTAKINEKIKVESFDSATDLVDEGNALLPNNEKILALYDLIDKSTPIYLVNMTETESFGFDFTDKTWEDVVGNTFSSNIKNMLIGNGLESIAYDDINITYYIGGKYNTFKLDLALAHSKNPGSEEKGNCFKIVGNDDRELYSSGLQTNKFLPEHLEIDVSGLDWIHLKVVDHGGPYRTRWIINNPRFYK